jgi:hypothetical protein
MRADGLRDLGTGSGSVFVGHLRGEAAASGAPRGGLTEACRG